MTRIDNRKDLVIYFRDQIEEIGFMTSSDDTTVKAAWTMNDGLFEKYFIHIEALGYIDDAWTIKIIHTYPIYDNNRIIMSASNMIKQIAVGKITTYSTLELDTENINELLEYINNIDVVKCRLRKKKLKRINGRLGIKVQGTSSTHIWVE